jgi:AcrR family transcriptional regulator
VSRTRPYHSPRREAQALATRQAILGAARSLFATHGVAATTIAEIAEAATVSRATVVATFGTKRAILEALFAALARGGDPSTPLREQERWRAMLDAEDATELLRRYAHMARAIHERTAELIEIVAREAPGDPVLEALRRAGGERRLGDTRTVIEALDERSWLRAGLSPSEATETLWAMSHPSLFRTLTAERGWSGARWERWLADLAYRALAAPG